MCHGMGPSYRNSLGWGRVLDIMVSVVSVVFIGSGYRPGSILESVFLWRFC